jgi:2-keto-4-pentenoate hydratase/2-oxohepta-3-ene-1,7-dioic acid hydratase in catechol pathway
VCRGPLQKKLNWCLGSGRRGLSSCDGNSSAGGAHERRAQAPDSERRSLTRTHRYPMNPTGRARSRRTLTESTRIAKLELARIASADGPRIVVAALDESGGWVDVRIAERLRLERLGASSNAAARLAEVLVPGSLGVALQAGPIFLDAVRSAAESTDGETLAQGGRFLVPIDPVAYRDFMAFEQHFVTAARKLRGTRPDPVLYEFPVSYFGNSHAILGPEDEIPWPHYTAHMDYELELGIVISKDGRDIAPDQAAEHILGLTVFNDFSARDIQLREMAAGLGPSKGKHFASSAGPKIVSLDGLPDALTMTARVNGEVWSQGSTGSLLWSIAELVAWASASEPLAAGTLLGSGTVGGGCGFELDRSLNPGDVVELEIERIGILRNRLGIPQRDGYVPASRVASGT